MMPPSISIECADSSKNLAVKTPSSDLPHYSSLDTDRDVETPILGTFKYQGFF